MTGRDDHGERDRPMPPIPDGGLAQTMPDWLRRPPAWRTEPPPTQRHPVAPPVGKDVPVVSPERPPVDDSVIDPRELILATDLPAWLRSLGVPQPPAPASRWLPAPVVVPSAAQVTTPTPVPPPAPQEVADDPVETDAPEDTAGPPAFRPRRFAVPDLAPTIVITPSSPAPMPQPVMPRLTIALAVALAIAILVILALLVA